MSQKNLMKERMEFLAVDPPTLPVSAGISRFRGDDGLVEYHLMLHPTEAADFETQLSWVESVYRQVLEQVGLKESCVVFRRFFCGDLMNQAAALAACPFTSPGHPEEPCAISWAGQPPLPVGKIALWAYLLDDPKGRLDKRQEGDSLSLGRGDLSHHWTTGITHRDGESACDQTRGIFQTYDGFLQKQGLRLSEHVVRTWFAVRDIDANYRGMVTARNEFFAQHGLTPRTHFIASTGIGGVHADPKVGVSLDAYAIGGVRPDQIEYLAAPDHLSPPHTYGVTFERGVAIAYRDRRHVLLSGTASIDSQGRIMHPGDVLRQLDRTVENMEALLGQAGASLKDLGMLLVYLRDASDAARVGPRLRERFGQVSLQMVAAPVCRPGWLIEMEGLAVIPATNPDLPPY